MPEKILVFLTETSGSGFTVGGREAMGLGVQIASALGGELDLAVFAHTENAAVAEALERGAARVFAIGITEHHSHDVHVGAACDAIRESGAKYVVFSRGPSVLDVVPRVAARLGGGCVMGVTEIRSAIGEVDAVAATYGGAARAVYRFKGDGPRIMTPAAGAAEPPPREIGMSGAVIGVPVITPPHERVRVVEPVKPLEGPRLEDATVVISGGRGIKSAENYTLIRELAEALGGMPGASRAIVDDSWATPAQQVGLTGKIVTPQLYIAAGISGASQHMAGCSNAKTLVAINTDRDAPIFRYAHFGIVDNCLEVLPELIRLARERSDAGRA